MTVRQSLCLVVSTGLAVCAVASAHSLATASPRVSTATIEPVAGKQLYRQFCGKCHALAAALSAGFGNSKTGLSADNGGPSFNNLRVPYAYTVAAVTEPTGGHELVKGKITPKQLSAVATFLAKVTIHHPIPALSTDG